MPKNLQINRNQSGFRVLWLASGISNLGDGVTFVAAPLLAATLTGDPIGVAVVSAAFGAPWLFFSLPAGAIVDRADRRTLMIGANLFRGTLLLLLAVAVSSDWATIPVLAVVFFLLGTAETLFDTASLALLPQLVPADELERANGRLYAVEVLTNELGGPVVGGLLFAAAAALPFATDAATFFLAAALLMLIPRSTRRLGEKEVSERPGLVREVADGLGYLWKHTLLKYLAVMHGVATFAYMMVFSILVLIAQDRFGLGDAGFGLLLASAAVGGIAGSVLAARIRRQIGFQKAIMVSLALGTAAYGGLGFVTSPILGGALLCLQGIHALLWQVLTVSARQALVPEGLAGRVNSPYWMIGRGALLFGALTGGLLVAAFGLTAPCLVAGALLAALVVATRLFLPSHVESDSGLGSQPEPAVA